MLLQCSVATPRNQKSRHAGSQLIAALQGCKTFIVFTDSLHSVSVISQQSVIYHLTSGFIYARGDAALQADTCPRKTESSTLPVTIMKTEMHIWDWDCFSEALYFVCSQINTHCVILHCQTILSKTCRNLSVFRWPVSAHMKQIHIHHHGGIPPLSCPDMSSTVGTKHDPAGLKSSWLPSTVASNTLRQNQNINTKVSQCVGNHIFSVQNVCRFLTIINVSVCMHAWTQVHSRIRSWACVCVCVQTDLIVAPNWQWAAALRGGECSLWSVCFSLSE